MDLWAGIEVAADDLGGMRIQIKRNLAFRIVQVAENSGSTGASRHTGRFYTLGNPVIAKIALVGRIGNRIEVSCAIWAGINANMAANADVPIYMHNTIFFGTIGRFRGA
jgi:hypothetical protein